MEKNKDDKELLEWIQSLNCIHWREICLEVQKALAQAKKRAYDKGYSTCDKSNKTYVGDLLQDIHLLKQQLARQKQEGREEAEDWKARAEWLAARIEVIIQLNHIFYDSPSGDTLSSKEQWLNASKDVLERTKKLRGGKRHG